jgi:hypothetical protein
VTLTPEQFKDRLDHDLLRASAGEPAMPVPDVDRAAGQRMLRRRRAGQAAAASLVAAAVVVTAFVVTSRVTDDHGVEVPAASIGTPPTSAQSAALLEQCSRAGSFRAAKRALYGTADPTVEVLATSGGSTWAMLRSADGKTSGTCRIDADPDAEFHVVLQAWEVGGPSIPGVMAFGSVGCATPPCDEVTVEWDDELPADVAAVRFDLGDGSRATVPTVDGFVLLATAARADPPYDPSSPDSVYPIHEVQYLGADEEVLAAQVLDVPPVSPDAGRVGDLPLLGEYPSLRGPPVH